VDSYRAEVVEITAGKAFNDVLTDDPHAEELSFDDSTADWRTFHVRVRVLEIFGGDETPNSEVTLGLAFGSDLSIETVSGGLLSMGEIVVFTALETDVFSYDPAVQGVLNDSRNRQAEPAAVPSAESGRMDLPMSALSQG
jgi:hypothetical protein